MMYAQYLRIETLAGGTATSETHFIRTAHRRLSDKGRSRAFRDARHAWLREGLQHLRDAKALRRQFSM